MSIDTYVLAAPFHSSLQTISVLLYKAAGLVWYVIFATVILLCQIPIPWQCYSQVLCTDHLHSASFYLFFLALIFFWLKAGSAGLYKVKRWCWYITPFCAIQLSPGWCQSSTLCLKSDVKAKFERPCQSQKRHKTYWYWLVSVLLSLVHFCMAGYVLKWDYVDKKTILM